MFRCGGLSVVAALVASLGSGPIGAQEAKPERAEITWPGLTPAGSVLLPNGWSLKPAGRQKPLGDLPVLIAEHPTEPILAVLHAGYGEHEVVLVQSGAGDVLTRVSLPETFSGLAWSADGARLFVGGGNDDVVYRFRYAGGLLSDRFELGFPEKKGRLLAGLALAGDGSSLWVAGVFGHSVARLDAETGALLAELDLGLETYPYGLAWDEGRGRLYVSLWGMGRVAVVDTNEPKVIDHWTAEEHPNEMLLARGGKVLYVANANRNTVSVFDTEAGRAVEVIGTAIDPKAPPGSTPSSLALTADESVLFVANANTNDLAAVNVAKPGASTPLGFIPTGWYPTSVRSARDGKALYVANGKGSTSKANRSGPNPLVRGGGTREYIASLFQGTLSIVPMPDPRAMAAYSKTVYECSPTNKADASAIAGPAAPAGSPIPAKVGDPSPITHCVYIIKENRTYDQVFGDIPEGNGEPALCLFPERVTPNHHALAREFVLLDNFYVESEVSADGHEWSMGAYATDFVERTWPLKYRGGRKMPQTAEGSETFAISRPAGGYLWDRAAAKGLTYRSYGEFVEPSPVPGAPQFTRLPVLQDHFDPEFRVYDLSYSDQERADRFLEELARFEAEGALPRLITIRLPNDHTAGTSPGKPTVLAYLADNDLALGRIVEALSQGRFWPSLAIFIVEDDAQNGSDHVDAHRTVALVASPYTRRQAVDSTMYSTSSMLRTMELILGLDPMSQFDAAARPMYGSFTPEPDLAPYVALPANINLTETNLKTAWGAEASEKLDLSAEDRADDLIFNEIIWKAVKGADSPMPPPVRAAFVLPTVEEDDDDD